MNNTTSDNQSYTTPPNQTHYVAWASLDRQTDTRGQIDYVTEETSRQTDRQSLIDLRFSVILGYERMGG